MEWKSLRIVLSEETVSHIGQIQTILSRYLGEGTIEETVRALLLYELDPQRLAPQVMASLGSLDARYLRGITREMIKTSFVLEGNT